MHSMWQDIQYGFRTLTQRPGFTLAAVVALGLGIGANTAIFGVVNGLMFRPLPVHEAGDLVALVGKTSQSQFMHTLSYSDVLDYGDMKDVFAGVIAHGPNTARITTEGNPERVLVTLASGHYFSLLQLDLEIGRGWQPKEGDLGGDPVIVLDHSYWQNRFGGDPSVVGSTLHLNGQPVTVLGVTPEVFPGTVGFVRSHVYVPFSTWGLLNPNFEKTLNNRKARLWRVVARLAPGVGIDEANVAVTTMSANLEEEYPESNKTLRAFVYPEPIARLEPSAVSYLPPVVTVFMLLVSLVLLIACANAANLLLARASERRREMAVRASLGAGRLRILRQLVTESVLIALAGGIVGLVLAHWAGNVLSSIRVASDIPFHFDFSIDYRVFGYAMLVALGAGLLAGLAPGVYAARTNLVDALKEGGRSGAGAGRHRVRSFLVAAQVAVSLVLLVCTALFVQSMRNITEVDPGFDYANRVMLSTDTNMLNYEEDRGQAFYRDLLARTRSLPGVRDAATARFVHIGYNNTSRRVYVEGEGEGTEEEQDLHNAMFNVVSSNYFSTLGISVLDGRPFTEQDDASARPVAVVNNTMAEEFWPDQGPLGKRFSVEGPGGPFFEIVGVVETGFYSIPGEPPQPMYYRPLKQNFASDQTLFVHTEPEPTSLVPVLRAEIRSLDADMPVFDVFTLESHVKEGKAELLFNLPARLVGAFALIGVVLAGLGLYAVIAYSVTQRTHEIGLRVALGASSSSIVRLVLLKGIVLGLTGVGLGVLLAYGVTKTFANFLIGVSASDPTTYAGVAVAVFLVALTACFIPAQFRATRIDPVVALREE